MAVQWGLAQPQGGGFDYLESLQALGQQQLQQQAIQQRQYGFDRQQQQDAARTTIAVRARTGDFAGARQDAALGGDFDFANALGSLDDDKIKRLGVELDAIGTLVPQLRALPADQRASVGSAALARVGFSPQELQAMDWTDAGLEAAYTMSASGKAAVAAKLKASQPVEISAGATLYDPVSKQALYQAPSLPKWQFDSESGSWLQEPGSGTGAAGIPTSGSSGSGGGSRAARNNNPGNIVDSAFARSQPGYQGSDGRFARFASADAGAGAQAALLGSYIDRGYNTVEKIINRWAPPSENDTGAYVRNVAKALNVSPGDTLTKASIPALQRIITRVEGGPGGSSAGGSQQQPGVVNVRPPKAGYRLLSDQEKQAQGLDPSMQYQISGKGQITPLGGQEKGGARKSEADLRKEFEGRKDVQAFHAARTQFNALRETALNPRATAQDDIAVIFQFMKTLDPSSTVREGEFATAQNAGGIPDTIRNAFNKAQNGERLNPEQRRNMAKTAYRSYQAFRDTYNGQAEQFRSYARDYGANPDRVARTYTPDKPARGGAIKVGQSSNVGGFTVTRVK